MGYPTPVIIKERKGNAFFLFKIQSIDLFYFTFVETNTKLPDLMKKFLFLLMAIVPFLSCEDTETNDVALQAKINNRLYQSTDVRATLGENDGVVIRGTNVDEALTLKLNDLREGVFNLRPGTSNSAKFEDSFGNVFKTNPEGEGTVEISEVDLVNGTITGTFNFSAMMPGVDTVYVSRGVIYRVPFGMDLPGADTGENIFKAKIDGEPFSALMVSAQLHGDEIVMSGTSPEGLIILTVPEGVEPGRYAVTEDGVDFDAVYQNSDNPEPTLQGEINIESHNVDEKTIKGTFWFNTTSHEITEGTFEVVYGVFQN